MKLTDLSLPYEGKEGPSLSDLESSHPALAPGDAPHSLPLHAAPADPGLALEEEASDGLGEARKVLLEVGQLGGVDLVWAVLAVLLLGLLYSLLLLCPVDGRVQGNRVLEGSNALILARPDELFGSAPL